jgi:hypothetical protein
MLQQMQRQMRGGGMQEMMKAMMQGQGGDPSDMEELQRTFHFFHLFCDFITYYITFRYDVSDGRWAGGSRGSRRPWRWWDARHEPDDENVWRRR